MMVSQNGSYAEKRDLHVGGVGSRARNDVGVGDVPWVVDAVKPTGSWSRTARDAVRSAGDFVRVNPLAAVGIAAFVSLIAGCVLSRR